MYQGKATIATMFDSKGTLSFSVTKTGNRGALTGRELLFEQTEACPAYVWTL